MGFLSGLGNFFGISSPGSSLSDADRKTEDTIQAALDKAYGTPGTFGQRKISADDAENALRASGALPAGWRLRESDSTSSGYRPTQAASKKMGALHAGEIGAAAFTGGASLAGVGGGLGANLATNAALQGGLGALGGGATGGVKGALLGGLTGAGGAAIPGVSSALTSNPLLQKGLSFGLNQGLNTARTGSFSPTGAAFGAAGSFLPSAASGLTSNPLAQRGITFGGMQGLNAATGNFNPLGALTGGLGVASPTLGKVAGFGGNMLGRFDLTKQDEGEGGGAGDQSGVTPGQNTGISGGIDWSKWGPIIAQGAGTVGGIFAGRAAQNAALQRSPEEATSLAGARGAADKLTGTADTLMGQASPYISQPASYYQTLLRGNRAAMANVTAPARGAINESYRGAAANLDRSGLRGAARDVQAGDLNRQRAGQVAGLTTGVQPAAAAALASLGTGLTGAALPLYGQAGSIYGSLLGQGAAKSALANQEGTQTGQSVGKLIADLGTLSFGGKKSTGSGQTPAARRQGAPAMPSTGPYPGGQTSPYDPNPPGSDFYEPPPPPPVSAPGDYDPYGDYDPNRWAEGY